MYVAPSRAFPRAWCRSADRVRSGPTLEKGQPLNGDLGQPKAPGHHGQRVRNDWMTAGKHAHLVTGKVGLLGVARTTGGHDVFPRALSTVASGHDVIERQLRRRQAFLAILAGMAVAEQYVTPTESHLGSPTACPTPVADHGWDVPGDRR